MRPYYTEFVRHCLRYYVKTLDEGKGGHPIFNSEAERENWRACHNVLQNLSERDMDIISHLYRPGDTIPDKIYELSKSMGILQDTIWSLVNRVERGIAKMRGLV